MDETRKEPVEVLLVVEGVELVEYADGSRELRFVERSMDNLDAAFDAIVAAVWLDEDDLEVN